MTLIFSLNPSVDVEWQVSQVVWEEKNNILSERRWAGGKGVNVARWFHLLAHDTDFQCKLVLPLGGKNGEEMEQYLSTDRIPFQSIPIREATRANIIVTTKDKRQLRFNPLGPELFSDEWDNIYHLAETVSDVHTVVFSGALPRNASSDTYRKFVTIFEKRGIKTILDCDGIAFSTGIQGHPFLVKPNRFELAQWAGQELPTLKDLMNAAKKLAHETTHHVLVSLGGEGALLLWNEQGQMRVWHALSPDVMVMNTIGAGDSLLTGATFGIVQGLPPEDSLRLCVATSTVAVSKPAGVLPLKNEVLDFVDKIQIQEL